MKFFTKPLTVEADQYTDVGHPEWVTLVVLSRHEVPRGSATFLDESGMVQVVLPNDWIVKWDDGSFQVYSEEDFEHRFSTEDQYRNLKESLDRTATIALRQAELVKEIRTKHTVEGVQQALETYDKCR